LIGYWTRTPESAASTFIENAGKNIADIGMPGADRFHVDDDAIQ
jgi:hypothetical protein